jgi:hypothetical protein
MFGKNAAWGRQKAARLSKDENDHPQRSSLSAENLLSGVRRRGMVLAEAVVGAGILAMVFAGLYALADRAKVLVSQGEIGAEVQRNCLARVDQLRNLGWAKVVKPDQVVAILAQPATSKTFTREVITVYALNVPQTSPTPSPAPTVTAASTTPLFTVTKTGTGTPVVSPSNFDTSTSLSQRQLNFRVLTGWNASSRNIERELSTVISKSATR